MICCCTWVVFVLLLARSCSAAGCAMMAFLTRTAKAAPQRWAILAQLGASVVRARACSCSAIRFTLHVLLLFGGGHLEGIVAQAQIGGCIRFLRQCSCQKPCQVHRSSQIPKSRTGRSCVAKFVELGLLGMVLRLQAPARTDTVIAKAKRHPRFAGRLRPRVRGHNMSLLGHLSPSGGPRGAGLSMLNRTPPYPPDKSLNPLGKIRDVQLALAHAIPPQPTIKQLDQALMTTWHAVDDRPASALPGIAARPHQHVFKLWEARANLLLAPRTDSLLVDCFRHWRQLAPVLKAELQLKRAARQRKRDFLNDCLRQAEEASASGNHALTYRIVRVLAPKQPKKRIQIRTPQGQVQRPSAERDTLVSYFRELYQSPPDPPTTESCPALYTQEGCLRALQALPRQKAVLPGAAPGILWSIGASALAPAVTDTLNAAYGALPEPPQTELTDISLCLLPKPAKISQQPADVRPISLLHPVNKIQAGMLAQMVKPYLTSYLQDIPQYAYVSERSAPEALCRVFSHLYQVRQNAPTKEGMVQRRQQGVVRTECKGGITFSLDVAKAFDTIPRWVIRRACEDANIPSDVIQHIDAVHEQLNVGLCHFGYKGSCRTSRGIRQGCNLAPSLWSLATAYVHKHLRSALGPQVDRVLTWFADDVIAQWQVQSVQDLRSALSQLSALVAALRQFGMDVSSQKSVILYSLHGTKAAQFLQASRIKRADKWHLRVSPDLDFPTVRQHKYLGVIISYGSFETHTLDYRTKCASATFACL